MKEVLAAGLLAIVAVGLLMVYALQPDPIESTLVVEQPIEVETSVLGEAPTESIIAQEEALPQVAQGIAVDPNKGYHVDAIGDGLYFLTDGAYTTMFMTTGQGVIVVDAPPSLGENYLAAIAEVTSEPVSYVIYSHSHADHIGAASVFPEGAVYIAHQDTASQLHEAQSPERRFPWGVFVGGSDVPLPTITFTETYTLNVGSQTLELSYKGVNHEPGNIFLYAPDHKTLMLVDVIFPGWSPFAKLALAEDIPGYVKAHDQTLAYDFDHFIGGHLNRMGSRQDVVTQREYILDMEANAAQALQTVDFMAIGMEVGFSNPWRLFNVYLDEVAQVCTDLTLQKWSSRLGGANVFTFDHCWMLAEGLRID